MAENGDKTNNTFEQVKGHVFEAADQTSRAVEEGIQAASYAVKAGTIKAKEEYSKAVESSQVLLCFSFFTVSELKECHLSGKFIFIVDFGDAEYLGHWFCPLQAAGGQDLRETEEYVHC